MSRTKLAIALVYLAVFLGSTFFGSPASAQNQSVGSGDWFDDNNWLDQFGNQDHPRDADNHTVHISGNHIIQILGGLAETDGDLHVGDVGGGTAGSGELHLLGDSSLNVSGFLDVGGAAGTQNALIIDTTGQLNGILRVGQNSSSLALMELHNGTVSGALQLGSLGSGRLDMFGGQFIGGNFQEPLEILNGGTLNQFGGSIEALSGTTVMEGSSEFNLIGGSAQLNQLTTRGGKIFVEGANGSTPSLTVAETLLVRSFFLAGQVNQSGELMIGPGGEVNVNLGFLASDRGASTTMTGGSLNGVGSVGDLVVSGGLFDGSAGQVTTAGSFLVQEGDNDQASIATFRGSLQTTVADAFAIGLSNQGNAKAEIADNASIESGSVQVGNAGLLAELEMSGGNLTTNFLLVGNGANQSRLNLSGGIVAVAQSSAIGRTSEATATFGGTVDVLSVNSFEVGEESDGTGTLVMNDQANLETGQLIVGRRGTGIANLNGQSTIDATTVFVGTDVGSNGSLNINDNGRLQTTQSLIVGNAENSDASVHVQNDGILNVGGSAFLATQDVPSIAHLEVVDRGQINISGDLFAGNLQGDVTVNVGFLDDDALLNVGGDASFGGSNSTTRVKVDGGEFRANNIFFDGFVPETTETVLDFRGGIITTNNNLEFKRGVQAEFGIGTLDVGQDLVIANEQTSQANSVSVTQFDGSVLVGRDFEFVADGESVYSLQGGLLDVAANANLGTGESDDAGFGFFEQQAGVFHVAGDLNNIGIEHVQLGGQLEVDGFLNVGNANDATFADFQIEGGSVHVQRSLHVRNDSLSILGGRLDVLEHIEVGDETNQEGFADFTISGGMVETPSLVIRSAGESSNSIDFEGGQILANEIFINSAGDSEATFNQFGGQLHTNEIITVGDSASYAIIGGSLQSISQSLRVDSDLVIGGEGELIFRNGEVVDVTGSLFIFDTNLFLGGNAEISEGVLNLQQIEGLEGDGFLSLLDIGAPANLLSGDALDGVHLLENFDATRLTEAAFLAESTGGNLNGPAFALVEGTAYGHSGTVGIAFANFSAVPEPGSGSMLIVLVGAMLLDRRRR